MFVEWMSECVNELIDKLIVRVLECDISTIKINKIFDFYNMFLRWVLLWFFYDEDIEV